jgi:hypothetical protein
VKEFEHSPCIPGHIETGLQRHVSVADLQALGFRNELAGIPDDQRHVYKTIARGAATSVWCATHPMLAGMGGVYCEDVNFAVAVDTNHKH